MEGLYGWISNITFYMIFITVVSNLLPNKKYEKYLKLFAGMVMILLVLKPLTGSLRLEDQIAYYFESITFRNESDDLKKEILGMENQRLSQMIHQYENAVALDVETMAKDMEFYSLRTDITIEGNQEDASFGTVTHIRLAVTREAEEEGGSHTESTIGSIEKVQIGDETEAMAIVPDEDLNRLRRKVEGYYGLQAADVEIWLEER